MCWREKASYFGGESAVALDVGSDAGDGDGTSIVCLNNSGPIGPSRRHIEAIDELTDEEAAELGVLLRRSSAALRDITGCVKTYVMQFAEAEGHSHVHFHIVPRMTDQPEERRSTKIFGYLGAPEEERVTEERMNEIAVHLRQMMKIAY